MTENPKEHLHGVSGQDLKIVDRSYGDQLGIELMFKGMVLKGSYPDIVALSEHRQDTPNGTEIVMKTGESEVHALSCGSEVTIFVPGK